MRQHLPTRVLLLGDTDPGMWTYTISCAPSDVGYRISVKRDSKVAYPVTPTAHVSPGEFLG